LEEWKGGRRYVLKMEMEFLERELFIIWNTIFNLSNKIHKYAEHVFLSTSLSFGKKKEREGKAREWMLSVYKTYRPTSQYMYRKKEEKRRGRRLASEATSMHRNYDLA